jgi:diguanylate cyclase (GGDEF)-like protein
MIGNYKVPTVLACAFLSSAVILISVGVLGVYGMGATNTAHRGTYENIPTLLTIERQNQQLSEARFELDRFVKRSEYSPSGLELGHVRQTIVASDREWNAYMGVAVDPVEKQLISLVQKRRRALLDDSLLPSIDALAENQQPLAKRLLGDLARERFASYSDAVVNLENFQVGESARLVAAGVFAEHLATGFSGAAIVAGLLSLALTWIALRQMLFRLSLDPLTGLVNRDEFQRRLTLALANTRKGGQKHALMYVDLDQFKLVNDTAGHAAGDQLLKEVVGLVNQMIRREDIFGRLGGDEFGLVLLNSELDGAQALASRICKGIDGFRFQLGSQRFQIGASIGLVMIDGSWPSAEKLLLAADSACYAAKDAGRNRVHAYGVDDATIESQREDMQWTRRLEVALEQGRFALYWQQVVPLCAKSAGLYGEVLLRLVDDGGKLVLPGSFMPAAIRFHMASRIDRWVLREVFGWLEKHRDNLAHVDTLSVNLSDLSMGDPAFHGHVLELVKNARFDPRKLCFEISETFVASRFHEASTFLGAMRDCGVRFALDNFGSGMSSFSYLKSLPVDYVKINGQFIRNLTEDQVDQATVRCIREVARITGKMTVAESVETKAVETMLREFGIDFAQGFLGHVPEPLNRMLSVRPPLKRLATVVSRSPRKLVSNACVRSTE